MTTLHRERQATSISQRLVHITFWWAHIGLVGGLVLVSRAGSDYPLQSSLGLLLCLTGLVALLAYFVALGASARQRGKSPILWGGLAFISSPLGVWVSYGLQFGWGPTPQD